MKLKVTCRTNEDLNGLWTKSEVEDVMRDLDIKIKADSDWIDYILSHLFDTLKNSIYTVILDPDVQSIIFKLDADIVKVEKLKW